MSPARLPSPAPALDLRVPGSLTAVDRAMAEARAFLVDLGLEPAAFAFLVALREALVNAVCHGCGLAPEKEVEVRLWVDGPLGLARVRDPGHGFDWRARWSHEPAPADEGGRGLWVMRRHTEWMEYGEVGNELTLCSRLRPGAAAPGSGAERRPHG